VITLMMSVCTEYPLGLLRFIPMRVHLWLDMILGIGLVVVPSVLLPASPVARMVLICFGVVAILASALTKRPHPHLPS
jgi:hypothetical protein